MKKTILIWTLASIVLTLFILWPIILRRQLPFPGYLLTGRFYPFNTQSWSQYPVGVPYKDFVNSDAVRQTYPWRWLAISQLQKGRMPWWNPYSFSGTPLLANLQSAALYPLNGIYWLLPFSVAWSIQVLAQPILAWLFMV